VGKDLYDGLYWITMPGGSIECVVVLVQYTDGICRVAPVKENGEPARTKAFTCRECDLTPLT
jgi:hypothetical protein